MKSGEAFNKVLASVVAISVFAATPSMAGPIGTIAVKAPIGGAPVGTVGTTFNTPGMTFSPMGASVNAPTLTGSVLPGVQSQTFGNQKTEVTPQADPQYMPTTLSNIRTQIPTLPPTTSAPLKKAVTGRVRQLVEHGSVATAQDLKPEEQGNDGSLRTVRGQRNRLGLRFVELRKAFGLPTDDVEFSPEAMVSGALKGQEAASVEIVGASSNGALRTRKVWTSRSYLARAMSRLTGFVQNDSPASSRAKATAPTPLGVNFSMERLAVSIFGGTPSMMNAADESSNGTAVVARDHIIRVSVPTPGTKVGQSSRVRSEFTPRPQGSVLNTLFGSPIVLQTAAVARQAVVHSFSNDGPLQTWLRRSIARVNAYASASPSVRVSFTIGSSRRSVVVPFPSLAARTASGWAAWFSSLVVPLTAMYLYFADSLRPRMALAPVTPRTRA